MPTAEAGTHRLGPSAADFPLGAGKIRPKSGGGGIRTHEGPNGPQRFSRLLRDGLETSPAQDIVSRSSQLGANRRRSSPSAGSATPVCVARLACDGDSFVAEGVTPREVGNMGERHWRQTDGYPLHPSPRPRHAGYDNSVDV